MRVLLVGATGVFGSRLAGLLAAMAGLDLGLAALSHLALKRPAEQLSPGSLEHGKVPVVNRDGPDLAPLRPDVLLDAAGLFQNNGLALATAAVEAGANVIDLADARAQVAAFPEALDVTARLRPLERAHRVDAHGAVRENAPT